MRAAVYHEYGPPSVLRPGEVPTPEPGPDEIQIRVRAVPVGFGDRLARNLGNTPLSQFYMPSLLYFPVRLMFGWTKPENPILGSELAGEVSAVGDRVTRFQVGDEVYAYLGQQMRGYAEYRCMPETGTVARMPQNLSFEQACTLPYGAIMATSLLGKADLQPGHKVLINGASGGIGAMTVQLCKEAGAEVTGVCGATRMDFVTELGADHVIDYRQTDFTAGDETYDLVFDILGLSTFAKVKRVLAPSGRYLNASFKGGKIWQSLYTGLFTRQKVIVGLASEEVESLDRVRELAEAGRITAPVGKTFPLEEAAAAHRWAESGDRSGPVVIVV